MALDKICVKKMVKLNGEVEVNRALRKTALKIASNFDYEGGKNYIVYKNDRLIPLRSHAIDPNSLDETDMFEIYKCEDGKEILLFRLKMTEDETGNFSPICSYLECSFEEFFQVCSLLELAW